MKYHCKCSWTFWHCVIFSQVWWVFLLLHQFNQGVERCNHLGPLAPPSSRPQVEKFQVARGVAHPWRGTRNIRVATQNPSHPLKCLRKEGGSLALRSANIRVFVCSFKYEYAFVGHKDKEFPLFKSVCQMHKCHHVVHLNTCWCVCVTLIVWLFS